MTHLLHGRKRPAAALHPIQRYDESPGNGTRHREYNQSDSRTDIPAEITSSTISTRPPSGAPTRFPPSPWSFTLFTIETERVVIPALGQLYGMALTKRNAFVGGSRRACQTEAGRQEWLWRKIGPSFLRASPSLNSPALKKYGDIRPAFVLNSPKQSTWRLMANSINSWRKLDIAMINPKKIDMRIITVNLNGVRSAANKGFFQMVADAGSGHRMHAGAESTGR